MIVCSEYGRTLDIWSEHSSDVGEDKADGDTMWKRRLGVRSYVPPKNDPFWT